MAGLASGLSGVSRTLLIPLYARAHAADLLPGAGLIDGHARAVVEYLGLDMINISRDAFPLRLTIARSARLEQALKGLLSADPERQIILFGCGLDTLPYRANWPQAGWICADLPEVMTIRDEVLPPIKQVQHLKATLPDQLDEVADALDAQQRPIFILEGVLPYLSSEAVQQTLEWITTVCPQGADILLDAYHPALLGFSRFGQTFRRMGARFRFSVSSPQQFGAICASIDYRRHWGILRLLPWYQRKRCILPWLIARGRPLATLIHLESAAR